MPEIGPGSLYPLVPHNFLALPPEQSSLEAARVALIPVPYDSTTSLRSGSRDGPEAMITASAGLEGYDLLLELDVSELWIHPTRSVQPHMAGPDPPTALIVHVVRAYLGLGLTVGLLGGVPSHTIRSVRAHV